MDNPNEAPTVQEAVSVSEVAESIFSDISNPAVESAATTPELTGSTDEPVIPGIPAVTDFTVPDGGTTQVDVIPPVAPPAPLAAPTAPVPTAQELSDFATWKSQQQQPFAGVPVAAAPTSQQSTPPTPAELDKALNRYTVPVEEFNNMFSETDPVKANMIFNDILEKKVIQAVTMAHHLVQGQAEQLLQQVQPYMSFADSQRELMLRDQFANSNPDLRGQDLLVQNVMTQMAAERSAGQYRPTSEQQVFTDVATRTRALIAQMQQQGQNPIPQQQGGLAPQVRKPAMAVLPSGGGGVSSAATSGAMAGESQAARSIFG